MHRNRPDRMPEWLAGLVIAVLLALAVWAGASLLGAGDDPVIQTSTTGG